jgi:hypothetical protein
MKIEQKKYGTTVEYDFKDDFLYYKIKDAGGSNSFNIRYEEITNDVTELEEKNQWYRNAGIFWIILGLIGLVLGGTISIWLILGVIFYGIYYFYQTSYSKIDATSHNLLVIKDKKHDEVMKEIFSQRNSYLKINYGKINEENDKKIELNKFRWLKNIGAIADYEFEDFRKVLEGEIKKLPEVKS